MEKIEATAQALWNLVLAFGGALVVFVGWLIVTVSIMTGLETLARRYGRRLGNLDVAIIAFTVGSAFAWLIGLLSKS
jgi:hypothetical protein